MARLDLQNAFWSIKLPKEWHTTVILQTDDDRSYRYTTLLSG